MKRYFRVMPGSKSIHYDLFLDEGFIGVDYDLAIDLTNELCDKWKDFNKKFIPVYLEKRPDKTRIAAGLACGAIWTISKGIELGDIILCPDGKGSYSVGELTGGYTFHKDEVFPHRRQIHWLDKIIDRSDMSEALQGSTRSTGTVVEITKHSKEIKNLITDTNPLSIIAVDDSIEDPSAFALEKHLEDFLVHNWEHTELGKRYDIFKEDGEVIGQQYPSDTGPIDILAVSKDKKELLVVELKRGRASDRVVGQIQRYMGYVLEELAEKDQSVRGIIIALEDDNRLKRALAVATNIHFYRYKINFELVKE